MQGEIFLGNKKKTVEKILGWKAVALQKKHAKVLQDGKSHSIIKLDSGEIFYCAKIPELTLQEALLLREMTKEFQETGTKKTPAETAGFIEDYCVEKKILLEKEQLCYFGELLNSNVFGFSALDCFLSDSMTEEIAIIGTGNKKPVFVFHKKFGWIKTNVFFGSNAFVRDLANKMARKLGRRLTLECPKLNANLPDGSRLTATIPPISKEASVTIRKFRAEPFTPIDLAENKTFSWEFCAFAWLAIELECSFLIAGNTGSGKTSTLNCLLAFVPRQERIIAVEETPEITLPHEHMIKMGVVKEQGFGMHSLITDTLRMRPDRVVVGEIRNSEEAGAFMDTLLAGQGRGSYATFHAQSSKEAIARLNSFGIKELDMSAIDLLFIQRRWPEAKAGESIEKRRIIEAAELVFSEKGFEAKTLFEFDFEKDCLKKISESSKLMEKARNFKGMDRNAFLQELEKRKKILQALSGKGFSLKDFFNAINRHSQELKK
ncbi:MAG TPA: type II/IV secretion system ATPase subunit [archaeon]|nr:type II/IV secretion system ATPase subunit [archaeon]